MKKLLLIVAAGIFCSSAFAQDEEAEPEKKNIIKINLPALAFKNISLQYERAVGKRISVAGTVRLMPKSKLPFRSNISKWADDAELDRQLGNAEVGNFAVMPEVRFYLGKKGALRGFYLGPFASFARYNADLLYEYEDGVTKTIPLSGDVNTITGGLMIGAQWKLSNAVSLDWWILGPNYGVSRGDLSGKQALTPSEQQSLRDELADLDIPLTKFTYDVNGNGASINFKGPWAGVRAGICIGINF
ncbi:MAG: DUF3575 domain-containing protein [Sphingobacteriales bacterium]|nr:MAG: DUF3575 domain-containing protein [Sphingobacteriales bacterium]